MTVPAHDDMGRAIKRQQMTNFRIHSIALRLDLCPWEYNELQNSNHEPRLRCIAPTTVKKVMNWRKYQARINTE